MRTKDYDPLALTINIAGRTSVPIAPCRAGSIRQPSEAKEPHHADAEKVQYPVGRIGNPKYIAGLVTRPASDQAWFMIGQRFIVDGGTTAVMIYLA